MSAIVYLLHQHLLMKGLIMIRVWRPEHTDIIVSKIHSPRLCDGRPCPVHNMSDHVLRSSKQVLEWVNGAAFTFRVCEHGSFHSDPDESEDYMARCFVTRAELEEGCDGCCVQTR